MGRRAAVSFLAADGLNGIRGFERPVVILTVANEAGRRRFGPGDDQRIERGGGAGVG